MSSCHYSEFILSLEINGSHSFVNHQRSIEYLLLRWSFPIIATLNENKRKIPDFCHCYRACWVTHRELRSICALKKEESQQDYFKWERLPFYDHELERDRLCSLISPTVPALDTRCPLCEETDLGENYLQHQLPPWSGSYWNAWALETQSWQHKWFPCRARGSRAPSLLRVLSAADGIDLLHLC